MNKSELIAALAKEAGSTKTAAEEFLKAFQGVVGDTLAKGDDVNITGFGKFSAPMRAERQGVNPSNGQPMTIPARRQVGFKAGKSLKDYVNA